MNVRQKDMCGAVRSRRAGFTLVEVMVALVLLGFILAILSSVLIGMSRVSTVVGNQLTVQSQSRTRLDSFVNDVHSSSNVLYQYTYNGTTYTTDHTTTVALQAPSYDSNNSIIYSTNSTNGQISSIKYDYIVYHLVADPNNPGRYLLKRFVVADPSSARGSSADTTVASNVVSATFTYLDDLPNHGDGANTVWPLNAAMASSSPLPSIVSLNGTMLNVGNASTPKDVYFAAPDSVNQLGTLVFTNAPSSGATIDAEYPVEAIAVNQDWITGVAIDLVIGSTSDAALGGSAVQTSELSGRTNLNNHGLAVGQL